MKLVASLAVLALGLVGCSSDTEKKQVKVKAWWDRVEVTDMRGKAEGDGQYKEVKIDVMDDNFTPQIMHIDLDVTVSWKNIGRSLHNILKAQDSQNFGAQFGVDKLAAGADYEFTFFKPGVYRYFCSLHGDPDQGMVGMIVVGDVNIESGTSAASVELVSGTLKVPQDYKTIQEAVDHAAPNSMVLVDKGVYNEGVIVSEGHENIVIRGVDRNETILDGKFDEKKPNGFMVLANGVAIENMTAMNYTTNAFYWRGVTGYRGSYLTSYRTGGYGIFSRTSEVGQFDHNYAAGSKDGGYYVGECAKCRVTISDSLSEWNGIGYSGTNSGSELLIYNNTFRYNRVGLAPNSQTGERLWPQKQTTIVGNLVYDNNNDKTAAIGDAQLIIGNGILIAGGNENIVERNRVWNHEIYGIGIIPFPEKFLDPNSKKAIDFDAEKNRIQDNVIEDSRTADLAVNVGLTRRLDAGGNCFSGNIHTTSSPKNLETLAPCDGPVSKAFNADLELFVGKFTADKPGEVNYKEAKLPALEKHPNMPDPLNAPPRPANKDLPIKVDLAAIKVPNKPTK